MFDLKTQLQQPVTAKDDFAQFYVPDGRVDPNFSEKRERAKIEQTIKDYEALRAKKATQYDDHYAERADAVVSFLKSRMSDSANGQVENMEKYYGRRMLAYFRGMEIRDRLMAGLTVKNKDGVIVKPGR